MRQYLRKCFQICPISKEWNNNTIKMKCDFIKFPFRLGANRKWQLFCQKKIKIRQIPSPVCYSWADRTKLLFLMDLFVRTCKSEIRKRLSFFRLEIQCWNVHAFFLAFVFVLEPKDLHSLLIRWGPENIFAKLNLLSCQCCFSSRVNTKYILGLLLSFWNISQNKQIVFAPL